MSASSLTVRRATNGWLVDVDGSVTFAHDLADIIGLLTPWIDRILHVEGIISREEDSRRKARKAREASEFLGIPLQRMTGGDRGKMFDPTDPSSGADIVQPPLADIGPAGR